MELLKYLYVCKVCSSVVEVKVDGEFSFGTKLIYSLLRNHACFKYNNGCPPSLTIQNLQVLDFT
jgi:hypothetical protein